MGAGVLSPYGGCRKWSLVRRLQDLRAFEALRASGRGRMRTFLVSVLCAMRWWSSPSYLYRNCCSNVFCKSISTSIPLFMRRHIFALRAHNSPSLRPLPPINRLAGVPSAGEPWRPSQTATVTLRRCASIPVFLFGSLVGLRHATRRGNVIFGGVVSL